LRIVGQKESTQRPDACLQNEPTVIEPDTLCILEFERKWVHGKWEEKSVHSKNVSNFNVHLLKL